MGELEGLASTVWAGDRRKSEIICFGKVKPYL